MSAVENLTNDWVCQAFKDGQRCDRWFANPKLLAEHAAEEHGGRCPFPGCTFSGGPVKLWSHLVAKHGPQNVGAPTPDEPAAARATSSEAAAAPTLPPKPKEEPMASEEACPVEGCTRPARHTGRHVDPNSTRSRKKAAGGGRLGEAT